MSVCDVFASLPKPEEVVKRSAQVPYWDSKTGAEKTAVVKPNLRDGKPCCGCFVGPSALLLEEYRAIASVFKDLPSGQLVGVSEFVKDAFTPEREKKPATPEQKAASAKAVEVLREKVLAAKSSFDIFDPTVQAVVYDIVRQNGKGGQSVVYDVGGRPVADSLFKLGPNPSQAEMDRVRSNMGVFFGGSTDETPGRASQRRTAFAAQQAKATQTVGMKP